MAETRNSGSRAMEEAETRASSHRGTPPRLLKLKPFSLLGLNATPFCSLAILLLTTDSMADPRAAY